MPDPFPSLPLFARENREGTAFCTSAAVAQTRKAIPASQRLSSSSCPCPCPCPETGAESLASGDVGPLLSVHRQLLLRRGRRRWAAEAVHGLRGRSHCVPLRRRSAAEPLLRRRPAADPLPRRSRLLRCAPWPEAIRGR
jgi:hypothetical protein